MQSSIGEQLKSAREAKNSSIEQASAATHIRPYFIEAMEEDRYTDIPSIAQVKGFIRLYADWLNLPSQPLLDTFDGKPEEILQPVVIDSGGTIQQEPSSPDLLKPPEIEESFQKISTDIPPAGSENEPLPDSKPTSEPESVPDAESEISSQVLFQEIGQQLQSCRETLGISIADIENLTHIRSRYLICNGSWSI